MKSNFTIGSITAAPGKVSRGVLGAVALSGGQTVNVPGIVINGERPGPTLMVMAGVHGHEVTGIRALLDAAKQMSPSEMTGQVVAIPVANPIAVQHGCYITPYDDVNLSIANFLPTNRTGSVTQRIASVIHDAIDVSDYVIDLHAHSHMSIPLVWTVLSTAPDESLRDEYMRFASAVGLPMVEQTRPSARRYTTELGKPGITVELGGDLMMLESITSVGSRGVLNCGKAMGILPGEVEAQELTHEFPWTGDLGCVLVRCNKGGFLRIERPLGELSAGEHFATVFNYYGDDLEEIRSPVDGYLANVASGYFTRSWAVCEGDHVAYIIKRLEPGEVAPGEAIGDFPGAAPSDVV